MAELTSSRSRRSCTRRSGGKPSRMEKSTATFARAIATSAEAKPVFVSSARITMESSTASATERPPRCRLIPSKKSL